MDPLYVFGRFLGGHKGHTHTVLLVNGWTDTPLHTFRGSVHGLCVIHESFAIDYDSSNSNNNTVGTRVSVST